MAAVVVWVREAVSSRVSVWEAPPGALVRELLPVGDSQRGPLCDFYVKCNGRRVGAEEPLRSGLVYSVEPRLCGGKGGFGSMLRALGAQIEKTTNREACRDLSGRRLRDVNHEKAMAEWIKKQADREAEKEQRRLERLKRKLAEPKHYFTDPEYHRQCSDMSERLEDSVIKGLQASSSSAVSADPGETRKRRKKMASSEKGSGKKKCFWTGLEGLEAPSSSDSGSESDSESPSTSASCSSSSSTGERPQTSDSDSDGPAQCSLAHAAARQSPECSRECSSVSADAEQPACDPDNQPQSSSRIVVTEPEAGHGKADCSTQESTGGEQPVCDPDNQPQSSSTIVVTEPEAGHREADCSMQESTGEEQPVCDPDEQPQRSSNSAVAEPSAEAMEVDGSMQESTDLEQPVCDPCPTDARVSPEAEKPPATTDPPQEASNVVTTAFDLLSFTSAAELELLGLEKLKVELMALGLKCGGTLQERAARLFSVRGLSRAQIDPALFAKPSKGKKK